jgi:hypothetical protein
MMNLMYYKVVEPHPFDASDFSSLNPVIQEILHTGIEILL